MLRLRGPLRGAEVSGIFPSPAGGGVSPVSFHVLEQLGMCLAELGREEMGMKAGQALGKRPRAVPVTFRLCPENASPGYTGGNWEGRRAGNTQSYGFQRP